MVHSEVVTIGPWIDITITTSTVLKILKEHFCDSDRSFTVQGKLTIRLQELLGVLLDKRRIINALLESAISKNALKELNIGGEANDLVVGKSILQGVNRMLSSVSVHDDL